MTATILERPALPSSVDEDSHVLRRLAVATAGASTCRGALLTAHTLAARHDAHVTVVSVFHPRIPYAPGPDGVRQFVIPPSDRHPARQQLSAVRHQLATLGVPTDLWTLSFGAGNVAVNVTELAKADHADLVIIGLGRDDPAERGLGDRGSMTIAASTEGPLLGVAPDFAGEARHVMVAVGSDASSMLAVQLLLELFPAPDRLSLVHVAEACDENLAIRARFDAIRQAVTAWTGSRVEAWTLEGDPIDQLLGFAREHEVDLIVGGSHGHSFAERSITRNAVLWLMGVGECSVLLVPFPPGAQRLRCTSSTP